MQWQVCDVSAQVHPFEIQKLGVLVGAGHIGILCLATTKISGSQKRSTRSTSETKNITLYELYLNKKNNKFKK